MSKRPGKAGKQASEAAAVNAAGAAGNSAVDAASANAVPPSDPALEKAKISVNEWADRAAQSVRAMEQVQTALHHLSSRNEADNNALQRLRVEAGFLASLKLDELKAYREAVTAEQSGHPNTSRSNSTAAPGKRASSAGGRGRKSGAGSVASSKSPSRKGDSTGSAADTSSVSQPPPSQLSGEAISITALDEKKRQKLHNALMAVYKSNPPPPPAAAAATPSMSAISVPRARGSLQRRGLPKTTLTVAGHAPPSPNTRNLMDLTSPLGAPLALDEDSSPSKQSAASVSSTTAGSASSPRSTSHKDVPRSAHSTSLSHGDGASVSSLAFAAAAAHGSDLRRPKDAPLPVWEELLTLRARRIALEAHVEHTNACVAGYLERLAVLQEQLMVARYGMSAAYDEFVRAGGLKEEVPPVPPVPSSRPGSRSASARGRGPSTAGAVAATAGGKGGHR